MFSTIYLDPVGFIAWLIVGLLAGWLAGVMMKGSGYGLAGDVIIGLIGAVIGGFLFGMFVPGTTGFIGSIFVAFLGACLLLSIFGLSGPNPRLRRHAHRRPS
jgi:uncharacterized membrane protein YeaQ/YmgE (transglycosylase-associated protein family)